MNRRRLLQWSWIVLWVIHVGIIQTLAATMLASELEPWFAAILRQESGGYPWTVLNNTFLRAKVGGASRKFPTRAAAETYAKEHIAMGHDLDLGKYQLNWKYQKYRAGVSLDNIFDPQVQEDIARQVLNEFYQKAKRAFGQTELAIRRAVGAYNNGNIYADNVGYLNGILRNLGKATSATSESTQVTATVSQANAGRATSASTRTGVSAQEGQGAKATRFGLDRQNAAPTDSDRGQQRQTTRQGSSGSKGWGMALSLLLLAGLLVLGFVAAPFLLKILAFLMKPGARFALRMGARAAGQVGANANSTMNLSGGKQ